MNIHLFAYGTLMCEDIMEEVSGCRLPPRPGRLSGFCRRRVKGEHYPAIVPDENGQVEGVIYQGVTASAWERLDRFEGEMYVRRPVTIEWAEGGLCEALTYVIHPDFAHCLDATEWSLSEFLRSGKARFQGQYKGYQALR